MVPKRAQFLLDVEFFLLCQERGVEMKKWTRQTAEEYIAKIDKNKGKTGLKYWSAVDYLKHHRTMCSII